MKGRESGAVNKKIDRTLSAPLRVGKSAAKAPLIAFCGKYGNIMRNLRIKRNWNDYKL